MITKRRIIVGVAVFIFAGLLVYTFASPSQANEEGGGTNPPVVDSSLNDEKTNAINELRNYVNLEDYRENEQNEINSLIEEGVANINNATTKEEIDKALEDAKGKIDEVPTDEELSAQEREAAITRLRGLLGYEAEDYTSASYAPYRTLVSRVTTGGAISVEGLTTAQIIEINEDLETAIRNLVLLNLESITIDPNTKEYKRLEVQGDIVGYAIYNDATRNGNVIVTTEDTFDSSVVTTDAKTMTYSYTNLYGTENTVSTIFTYTVIANDKDVALNNLQVLFNGSNYNELDYTSASYAVYKTAYDAINALVVDGIITVTDETTKENIDTLRTNLETAISNLVLLNLESITIDPNTKEYKRLEDQGSIVGYAKYNDTTKNGEVVVTTLDTFDSSVVATEPKTMTYSYTNLYGTKNTESATFTYTVVANGKDIALENLQVLFNSLSYNELDYTSASYAGYKTAYDAINALVVDGVITVTDETTIENINTLIINLETAINNLVLLDLESITITPNTKEYKRLEAQGSIVGYATYNDTTRNGNVTVATGDTFDSSVVTTEPKTMTYSYTNLYGTKNTKSATFTYTVVLNDYDLALIQAKIDAKEELEKYNDDVIYGDKQDEVNDIKENGYTKIDESTTLEEVEEELNTAKEEIDKLGAIYTINFIEYNKTTTKKVVAGIGIEAPNATKTYKTHSNSINYNFTKWSTDAYKANISSNLDVKAVYEIVTAYVNIYVKQPTNAEILKALTDGGFNIKVNSHGYYLVANKNTVNLKNTDQIKTIIKNNKQVKEIATENIGSFVEGNLPKLVLNVPYSKYYKYSWTVFKFETSDGFHIDGEIVFDYDSFIENEINKYLDKNANDYTTTSYASYKTIVSEINSLNLKEQSISKLISLASDLQEAITKLVRLELMSIELNENNKTYQRTNDNNAALGVIVTAIYNDTTRNKNVTNDVTVTGFDTTTLGKRTATISYNGKEVELNYEVIRSDADKVKKLQAVLNPNVFEQGQEINNTKKYLTVNLVSEDGIDSTPIEANEYETTRISTRNIGSNNITVSYTVGRGRNSKKYTTTVSYTVVARLNRIELSLENNSFTKGSELTGLTVTGFYSDRTSKKLDNCTTDFNSESVGYKTLTVTCGTKTNTTSYSIYDNELKKIEASLDKSIYEVGDTINATVKYTNEYGVQTTLNKKDYKSSLSTLYVGEYNSKIEYNGLEDTVSYKVIEKQIVGTNKFKLSFTNKNKIRIEQTESWIIADDIYVTYEDKKRENIGFDRNFDATVYTTNNLGNKKTPIKIEVYYHKAFGNSYISTYAIEDRTFKFVSDIKVK